MRHARSDNRLGRSSSWRKATVRDIAKATLIHQRIRTTKTKAKEARKVVDRLITLGKKGTLAGRRKAFAILSDHKLVSELFNDISPRFQKRPGGYTRVIPLATTRRGDNASMAFLELTEKSVKKVSKAKKPAASAEAPPGQTPASGETDQQTKGKEEKPSPESKKTPPRAKDEGKKQKAPGKKGLTGGIKKIFNKRPPKKGKDS